MTSNATTLIGIDWGTSRRRAYRIDQQGNVLESRSDELGLSAAGDRNFDAALQSLISDWREDASLNTPVLMCGMIGSRNGWAEVPYCECPFGIDELSNTIVPIMCQSGTIHIVGGGSVTDARHHHDVMRGEETQFFGLDVAAGHHSAVAPGTHSKWASLDGGRISKFRTYMTGELYALLKEHSILSWLMPNKEVAVSDEDTFLDGVRDAIADNDLLHGLFNVRTIGLFRTEQVGGLASYLSGLLIGYEIAGALKQHSEKSITIIAAPHLARLYNLALVTLGVPDVRIADVDAVTARGLWRIWQARRDAL
jgi:2-dehydro-3-deoxygalactonokinase